MANTTGSKLRAKTQRRRSVYGSRDVGNEHQKSGFLEHRGYVSIPGVLTGRRSGHRPAYSSVLYLSAMLVWAKLGRTVPLLL